MNLIKNPKIDRDKLLNELKYDIPENVCKKTEYFLFDNKTLYETLWDCFKC